MKLLALRRGHSCLLILILFFTSASSISAQNLPPKTTWEGNLGAIRIVLKISQDSITKQRVAVFDSPDQGAFDLKVSALKITSDSVSAYSAIIGGGYNGAFNVSMSELVGHWNQGMSQPLKLKRVENRLDFKRPQMPKGPFPYSEERLTYRNADQTITFGATLTVPKTEKTVPAVILISGSGSQDRDETLFGHKIFWVMADYLSRYGIAVLRVDDRGVGQTTGDVLNATSADYAKDVLAGVEFLKSQKGIDSNRMGLIGHSEGGVIAPLAANQSPDIAFIVSMAGVGTSGMELWNYQATRGLVKAGYNDGELKRMYEMYNVMFKISNKYQDINEVRQAFQPAYKAWLKQQPEDFLMKAGLKGPNGDALVRSIAERFFSPWMRYLVNYDPANVLTKITIPVLAVNGEKDVQVLVKPNLDGFEKYLNQAGNKQFKTIGFQGLNHLFQTADTGEISEYAAIEETISPEVLKVIAEWIREINKM